MTARYDGTNARSKLFLTSLDNIEYEPTDNPEYKFEGIDHKNKEAFAELTECEFRKNLIKKYITDCNEFAAELENKRSHTDDEEDTNEDLKGGAKLFNAYKRKFTLD